MHMADAYGRLTGRPGIAWVTGGPGHANAVGALFTALGQETPMVLMSGHTETDQLGRGGFQELRQVEMAAPVCKAAWMATDTATVGMDVAKAVRIATSGRPGPVHLSLPSDVLDATVDEDAIVWPSAADFAAEPVPLTDAAADAILSLLAGAKHPLVIGAPVLATAAGRGIAAPDRDDAAHPDLHQRGTARLQRRHPRRLCRRRASAPTWSCCWARRSISP